MIDGDAGMRGGALDKCETDPAVGIQSGVTQRAAALQEGGSRCGSSFS